MAPSQVHLVAADAPPERAQYGDEAERRELQALVGGGTHGELPRPAAVDVGAARD